MFSDLKVFTGNGNPALAQKICDNLGTKLTEATVGVFPGLETRVQLQESVRGEDVFLVQPICATATLSPNDTLMELLLLADAARRSSADRITAVIPYFGYARQDRKDKPRVPISAKLIINMLETAGIDRFLTMDLHSNQIQGFTDLPFDHLYSIVVFAQYLREQNISKLTIASPDSGSIKMARAYATFLKTIAPIAIIDKRRISGEDTEVMNVIGDVVGANVWFVDDIVSTAGTLAKGADAVKSRGACTVNALAVHPILSQANNGSPSAAERIEKSVLSELLVSDSVPILGDFKSTKIKVISVAPLLADAIYRIHNNKSVSSLFVDTRVEG